MGSSGSGVLREVAVKMSVGGGWGGDVIQGYSHLKARRSASLVAHQSHAGKRVPVVGRRPQFLPRSALQAT